MYARTIVKLGILVGLGALLMAAAYASTCHTTCYRLGTYTYCDTTCD